MMLVGWGTLAVPTGIVTSEMTAQRMLATPTTRTCHECLSEGHQPEAKFCCDCGARLHRARRVAANLFRAVTVRYNSTRLSTALARIFSAWTRRSR